MPSAESADVCSASIRDAGRILAHRQEADTLRARSTMNDNRYGRPSRGRQGEERQGGSGSS